VTTQSIDAVRGGSTSADRTALGERAAMTHRKPHRHLHRAGTLAGALLLLASLAGCRSPDGGNRATDVREDAQSREAGAATHPAPPPSVHPGPWIDVDAAAARGLEGRTIYHQGPEPPVLTERVAARLPAPSDAANGLAIVQTVVSTDGKVVRMQVMRAPAAPGLDDALVDALRRWRFEPARLDGEPVPVFFMVTVELRPTS